MKQSADVSDEIEIEEIVCAMWGYGYCKIDLRDIPVYRVSQAINSDIGLARRAIYHTNGVYGCKYCGG